MLFYDVCWVQFIILVQLNFLWPLSLLLLSNYRLEKPKYQFVLIISNSFIIIHWQEKNILAMNKLLAKLTQEFHFCMVLMQPYPLPAPIVIMAIREYHYHDKKVMYITAKDYWNTHESLNFRSCVGVHQPFSYRNVWLPFYLVVKERLVYLVIKPTEHTICFDGITNLLKSAYYDSTRFHEKWDYLISNDKIFEMSSFPLAT